MLVHTLSKNFEPFNEASDETGCASKPLNWAEQRWAEQAQIPPGYTGTIWFGGTFAAIPRTAQRIASDVSTGFDLFLPLLCGAGVFAASTIRLIKAPKKYDMPGLC
jgi:hypothetical protein